MCDGVEQWRTHLEGGHGSQNSGQDENGDFTLTVARLALLLRRGGREEDGVAAD